MRAVDDSGGPGAATLRNVPAPGAPEGLAKATEDLLATSLLLGIDHASGTIDLADDPFSLPFEEAVSFLKARVPLTKKEWNELEPKLRFRAFTVAALSTPDSVERVRRMAIAAVEKGVPLSEFWTAAKAEGAAGLGDSPWYWETVFRTNVQTAYNAGRAVELTRNQAEYLEFVGIGDSRQTAICRTRSGTVLPATHPFWKSNWPPLHFNCRSTVRAVYQEEVDAIREEDPKWNPTDDSTFPHEAPAKGFGGNPVDSGSFWKMTATMKSRALQYGVLDEIEHLATALDLDRKDIKTISTKPSRLKGPGEPLAAKAGREMPGIPGEAPSTDLTDVPVFKTVKEAERWIVSRNLAGKCSFKGCDLKVVQEWTESLVLHYGSFPAARSKLQFIGTIQERNALMRALAEENILAQLAGKGFTGPDAQSYAKQLVKKHLVLPKTDGMTLAEYAPWEGARGIAINRLFGADHAKFLALREQDVRSGWKPAGTGKVSATLHHEAGHWLDDVYGLSSDKEVNSLYQGFTDVELETGLSGYAADARRRGSHGIQEFIAEGWSEYMESRNPRPIARLIGELIERRARWK